MRGLSVFWMSINNRLDVLEMGPASLPTQILLPPSVIPLPELEPTKVLLLPNTLLNPAV